MNKPAAHIEIFRAGTHTAVDGRVMTFSEQDVAQAAASYDPTLSEAPMVVGHPKLDAPAYGWAKSLSVKDGVLYAEPHQVDADFAQMVNAGRFKKRSASFYLPDTPGNPTPGKFYLRHIGFLGAAPPSLKGLRDVQFADGGEAVEFAMPVSYLGRSLVDVLQRLRDWFVENQGAEKADQIIPQWQIRSIDEQSQDSPDRDAIASASYADPSSVGADTLETEMSKEQAAEFAERENALNTRQTAIDQREKALKDREEKARRADAVAFADELASDGRVLPRHKSAIVELLLALPPDAISFAEGDQQVSKPGADLLRGFLSDLPKQIDFAEKSGDTAVRDQPVSFAAPAGAVVSADRAQLYAQAKAYQAQHPNIAWTDAVAAVGG
jgi:hypothetical protein